MPGECSRSRCAGASFPRNPFSVGGAALPECSRIGVECRFCRNRALRRGAPVFLPIGPSGSPERARRGRYENAIRIGRGDRYEWHFYYGEDRWNAPAVNPKPPRQKPPGAVWFSAAPPDSQQIPSGAVWIPLSLVRNRPGRCRPGAASRRVSRWRWSRGSPRARQAC